MNVEGNPRRLALIVRGMPPVFAGEDAEGDDLRPYYYGRLWRQWTAGQRLLARALNGLPPMPWQDDVAARAWRLGFRQHNLAEVEARRRPDARIAAFLDQDERKGIHAIVNGAGLPLDHNPLKNKYLFENLCRRADLPLPAAIAAVADVADHAALISKPRFGSKGRGVVRFVRQPGGDFRASDGSATVPADQLAGWLASEQAKGRIVQQCLVTDPALAAMSPGALPTLRLVTFLDEQGAPEVTDAVLRLSLAEDRAADNFNIDNLVAPVDLDSGRIGSALRRGRIGFVESAAHPLTGAPIAGEWLAPMAAAMALARHAHTQFAPAFAIIGWDIGLSDRGPVLIEGNWNPGYNVLQLVHGVGLGELRVGTLYRHHLECAPDAAWAAATPLQIAQIPWARTDKEAQLFPNVSNGCHQHEMTRG